MTTHTYCWYNPITNELKTNLRYERNNDFECVGSRKTAEALTSVNAKDRPLVYKAIIGGMINTSLLSSRLRHKLRKIGIKDYPQSLFEYYSISHNTHALNILNRAIQRKQKTYKK